MDRQGIEENAPKSQLTTRVPRQMAASTIRGGLGRWCLPIVMKSIPKNESVKGAAGNSTHDAVSS